MESARHAGPSGHAAQFTGPVVIPFPKRRLQATVWKEVERHTQHCEACIERSATSLITGHWVMGEAQERLARSVLTQETHDAQSTVDGY